MNRKTKRNRRPPPLGAVFLLFALICVLAIIFWPRPAAERGEPAPAAKATEEPPVAIRQDSTAVGLPDAPAQVDLETLVGRLLAAFRIPYRSDGDGVDLTATVPPGRSRFALHGEIAEAAALWGGRVESGQEKSGRGGRETVDLRLVRGREVATLRLARGDPPEGSGRIALVIDDFGFQSKSRIDEALALPIPFTPSILPGHDRSAWALRRSLESRRAPLLHLPMEPDDPKANDPGPNALRVGMDRQRVRGLLTEQLDGLEGVVGVNHHMGSRASGEPSIVGPVVGLLAERGLFYLDSGTSDRSVCAAEAAGSGTPCLVSDLFLDGESDWSGTTMAEKLQSACDLARSNGSAILIAHARPATIAFLASARDTVAHQGCRFVPLGDLLR